MRGWRTLIRGVQEEGAREWRRVRLAVKKTIRAVRQSNGGLAFQAWIVRWRKTVAPTRSPIIVDEKRRAFLKYAVFGGVVFLIGKYIDPFINMLRGDTVLGEKSFEHFKYTETGREIRVSDDEGAELLTIDKEGF